MVNAAGRRMKNQRGQAVVLLVLSLAVFLLAAMGLALDGSQLYAQRQMAQSAADAAAQAGIATIFNGSGAIGSSAYYCTSSNTTSPCAYASKNGYTAGSCTSLSSATPGADCIYVNPSPAVTVSNLDSGTPNELQVSITRAVPMTLMKILGIKKLDVTAVSTAAIVDVISPIPMIITHPWMAGSFSMTGNVTYTICGGPQRSIQVNSYNSGALSVTGNNSVSLSTAGPNTTSTLCAGSASIYEGTGGDFAVVGGTSSKPAWLSTGSTGNYLSGVSPISDPLANVTPPSQPAAAKPSITVNSPTDGCPSGSCTLYYPGLYTSSLSMVGNINALFAPGIYYFSGNGVGLSATGNINMYMATGLTDGSSGTNTGWTGNMMVYFTGPSTTPCAGVTANQTGTITLTGNISMSLVGAPNGSNSTYKGILFWVDRNAVSNTLSLTGNGGVTLTGTIYATDTLGLMSSTTCSQYQTVNLVGNNSATSINGEIIASMLSFTGNGGINMNLNPTGVTGVRQIALVGNSGGSVPSE